jgi:hypothetical protein
MNDPTPQQLALQYAPAVLHRLGRLPSKDQLPIASWLIKFPIGTNYAMQVLECLEDLSRKEEAAPSRILHQILTPLTDYEGHPKELGRRVRDALHKRLHPVSATHQERFRAFVKQLGLPDGVKLHPPKNFEGTTYQMVIEFESTEALQEKLKYLDVILEKNFWESLEEF